jgi:hypothetical protein
MNTMRYATLIFPDIESMVSFIFDQQVINIETHSKFFTIKGMLSEDEIVIAETQYRAQLYSTPLFKYQEQ